MEAMATGLKLKRRPARKPIPMTAIPAFATACCRASGVTSFLLDVPAGQGRAQLLRSRQGREDEFAVDHDCRQRQHAVLDGAVHLLQHVDFAPFQFGDHRFGGGLQPVSRGSASTAARSMEQLYFHISMPRYGYLLQ